jgi:hypothetical protein
MITLESGGMSHSNKIVYSISKIRIPQNERKQTGPYRNGPRPHFPFNLPLFGDLCQHIKKATKEVQHQCK